MVEKVDIARENVLKSAEEVEGLKIRGYDFKKGVNFDLLIESFKSTGLGAFEAFKAIEIINKMIEENAFIFLGYTSNMVSSGIREIIRALVELKKVNSLVTTCGGIEEDIIKCLGDFYAGDFFSDGKELRNKAINRIGNIFVSNNRYIEFENFVQPILEFFYQRQIREGKILKVSELILELGRKINNKESILYWAFKNNIPVHCPAIGDGALGDQIYFFKHKRNDFLLDISDDIKEINDSTIGLEKSGVIVLGAGVVKHSILNANLYRNGADYGVFINTSIEYDGSDSGALPGEAVSWGKLGLESKSVKIYGDASIIFPLIAAKTFFKK